MILAIIGISVGPLVTERVLAYVSSSANYRIQSDSVNVGGVPASSASYNLNTTVGEVATGESTSASYKVKAGYQQMQGGTISITSPSDISFSRSLSVTDNTATASTTWTVTTDISSGYNITITASSTSGCVDHDGEGVADALCDTATNEAFNDLATTSKATWSVSNAYAFGWSAYGDHVTGFGTGSSCDTGDTHTPSTSLTYQGFDGVNTSFQFASSTSATGGTATTMCFAVEQNDVFAPSGSYQATTTATAVSF